MMLALAWIKANPWTLVADLWTVLNVINGLLPPKARSEVGKILTVLNTITLMRRGTLSPPMVNGASMAHDDSSEQKQ